MTAAGEKTGRPRGRPPLRPETAADRRRRWSIEVEASGLLAEQIARVVRKEIPTVWSYNSATGTVPTEASIRALAKRNLEHARSQFMRLGIFDDDED